MAKKIKRKTQSELNDVFGFNPREMTMDQKQQYLRKVVERANKRITRLNKSGIYSYALNRAQAELAREGRKRFSYKRPKTEHQIIREIYMVESFLSLESSLVSNVKKIQDKAFNTLSRKLESKGVNVKDIKLNKNDFYRFLNSQEFKDIAEKYGSDWVVEDITRTMESNKKITLDQIIKDYEEFMKEDLPFEAVELKHKGAISDYDQYRKKRKKQRET